jgi:hypothetical protein
MHRVALEFSSGPQPSFVALRGLRGDDEESVTETGTEAAIALLDRLLVEVPGASAVPSRAAELATPDRDRLLATIYQATFGPRVESTIPCRQCGEQFDLDFVLDDLRESLRESAGPSGIEREDGALFRLPDGRRFRLPTGVDELALLGLDPAQSESQLLDRCLVDGQPSDDPAAILDGMDAVGPLLSQDLDAQCPACGAPQTVRFDLQHYLLSLLVQEDRRRAAEIHQLARTYGWGLGDILSLPRARRRALVEQIEQELSPR